MVEKLRFRLRRKCAPTVIVMMKTATTEITRICPASLSLSHLASIAPSPAFLMLLCPQEPEMARAVNSTGMSREQVRDYIRAKLEVSLQEKQIGKFKEVMNH